MVELTEVAVVAAGMGAIVALGHIIPHGHRWVKGKTNAFDIIHIVQNLVESPFL